MDSQEALAQPRAQTTDASQAGAGDKAQEAKERNRKEGGDKA